MLHFQIFQPQPSILLVVQFIVASHFDDFFKNENKILRILRFFQSLFSVFFIRH